MKKTLSAGGIVLNDKGQVLLIHQVEGDAWCFPKGHVEEGEDLLRAAEREVYEELGSDISLAPLEYFGSVEFTVPDGRIAVANKFLTKILSGEPQLAEPEVFDRFDYISIIDLENKNISSDLKLFLDKLNLQS